ncbi:MAG: hypothetical protein ACM3UL_00705 [Ignavibacteria bacterium]
MKYETLHHTAKQIDHLIDHYLHYSGSSVIAQEELEKIVLRNFPDLYVKDVGWHKIVFGIRSVDQKIVLKVGSKRIIENDHRAYKQVPESMRHKLFARIFWHTKHCLLQEYGYPANVSQEELTQIRRVIYKYGIFDVKAENLKRINGKLKIIDANVTSIPIPFVLRKVDEVKPKLPKRLVSSIRKITKTFYEK